mmetsp:Transcript_16532/g.27326  ORF Transcript_16532/g.27326 Transcript_16532/m.27326 type:complete len:496 (-) Transcript_16532:20-1507(-)
MAFVAIFCAGKHARMFRRDSFYGCRLNARKDGSTIKRRLHFVPVERFTTFAASAIEGKRIVVIGAGPCGSLMALLLAKRGAHVNVFERRANPKLSLEEMGRSIPIGLGKDRSLKALSLVGLEERVLSMSEPLNGFQRVTVGGSSLDKASGQVITRATLAKVLVDEITDEKYKGAIDVHFSSRCTGADFGKKEVFVVDDDGSTMSYPYDFLIAADGASSAVREALQEKGLVEVEKWQGERIYKSLFISEQKRPDLVDSIDKGLWSVYLLKEWPQQSCSAVRIKEPAGVVVLFWGVEEEFDRLEADPLQLEKVLQDFKEVLKLPDSIAEVVNEQFYDAPRSFLRAVKCSQLHYGDSVVLLGDAAHAIDPAIGQGLNSALEDCILLDNLIADQEAKGLPLDMSGFTKVRGIDAKSLWELSMSIKDMNRRPIVKALFIAQAILNATFPKLSIGLMGALATGASYSEVLRKKQQAEVMIIGLFVAILVVVGTLLFKLRVG